MVSVRVYTFILKENKVHMKCPYLEMSLRMKCPYLEIEMRRRVFQKEKGESLT